MLIKINPYLDESVSEQTIHLKRNIEDCLSESPNQMNPIRLIIISGSGALSGKMLLVWIVENNRIDDYLGQVRLSKG